MASARKTHTGSRRGPNRDEIIKGILGSYHATLGCSPPLAYYWYECDLAKTGWLKKFAEEIADDNRSLEAWNTLKEKFNPSWIIELLYMLTVRGNHWPEQDSRRAFAAEIEKTISKYDKLLEDINRLIQNPLLSEPIPDVRLDLTEEFLRLQDFKERLEAFREFHRKSASYKRNHQDWYLVLMARQVRDATGHLHVKALASLIDSARAAHNPRPAHKQRGEVTDAGDLKTRIWRYNDFLNSLSAIRSRNTTSTPDDTIQLPSE